jgi:hypothetical protein
VFAALIANQYDTFIGEVVFTVSGSPRYLITINDLTVTLKREEDSFRYTIVVTALNHITSQDPGGGPPSSGGLGSGFSFWIDETCSFVQRGVHMLPFPGAPLLTSPTITNRDDYPINASSTNANNTVESLLSFPASFYYSRYITVISENLSLYTFGESRVDRSGGGGGTGKIIGVFATTRYNGNGKGIPYVGVDVIKNVEAPVLGINNAQLKLNELLDFRFEDEFGVALDDVFPLDHVNGPTLAFNLTY